jgi:hypothetical protein
MTNSRLAAQIALEALEDYGKHRETLYFVCDAYDVRLIDGELWYSPCNCGLDEVRERLRELCEAEKD